MGEKKKSLLLHFVYKTAVTFTFYTDTLPKNVNAMNIAVAVKSILFRVVVAQCLRQWTAEWKVVSSNPSPPKLPL